ncbi:uncharacterized protein SCODWIG_03206 [Saccharomycodes ludwigii]|uniref:TMEM205-like domain-containing protein n=1 Tax=Saccharomycodes ludwigii TaxID=36035 RepID=A0A376B9T3_9ASCO|nr:hypothetical protein SCDLUD_000515 [Saccharomycodes ludwigii]KAH3902920.1 hypothetical protein SCDLUD_000515 [Saccharomycodes ludwigii]SSD61445.1 uncharacterized protein SCODWIG_03206 [Saccharomycodes ludwigii]
MSFVKPTTHILLYSFLFGGVTFYSYFASPIAFKTLERKQFSILQHKVFPGFFTFQTLIPIALYLTYPLPISTAGNTIKALLSIASITGLANLAWISPWCQEIKEKRSKVEEASAEDLALRKEFGKAHGLSLLFNLSHAVSLLAYGVLFTRKVFKYIPK